MAVRGRDVLNGYKAMLVAYRRNGGVIEAVSGTEASSKRFFVKKALAATPADAEQFSTHEIEAFKNRHTARDRCVVATRETGEGQVKDTWRTDVKCPGSTFGFPKGGEQDIDGANPETTATREFREEIGVDLTGRALVRETPVRGEPISRNNYHIFSLDVTGNDAAINAQIGNGYLNELFDIGWVNINSLPRNANEPTRTAANLLLRRLAPPPAAQARGAVGAPGPNFATSEAEANAFLQAKLDDPTIPGMKKLKYSALKKKLENGQITFGQIELSGGRRTRRTGRSKPGTKKRHTGGRGRKTRRSP